MSSLPTILSTIQQLPRKREKTCIIPSFQPLVNMTHSMACLVFQGASSVMLRMLATAAAVASIVQGGGDDGVFGAHLAIHRSVGGWDEGIRPLWCNYPNYTEARASRRVVVSSDPCMGGSSAPRNVSLRSIAKGGERSAGKAGAGGRRAFGSASCSGSYTPMVINPGPYWSNDDAKNTDDGCGRKCEEMFGVGKAEWWNVWWSRSGTSYCRCYICCDDPQAGSNPSCVCQSNYYGNGRSCTACPSGSSTSTYGKSTCECSSATEAWTGSSCDSCCSQGGACTGVASCTSSGVRLPIPPSPPPITGTKLDMRLVRFLQMRTRR